MGNSNSIINEYNKGKIEKKYFSNINRILTKKNCVNYSLTNNLKICLSEKNFDQVPDAPVQYFTLNAGEEPKYFIHWLDFIYQYLSKESSLNCYWADEMMAELDKESFLSENKYLSEFFLEEFEFENAPDFLLKERVRVPEAKINVNKTCLNVTQNLGGSFMNSQSGSMYTDLTNLKYKHFRDKVKGYIYKFKQHIFNKDHPIKRVTQIFVKVWTKFAEVKINSLKEKDSNDKNTKKEIDTVVNELTQELQRFVVHLQICLKLFYSRTINYAYFGEEKDELINLITTLLFKTGDIYSTVFDLYSLSLEQEIQNLSQNFYSLKKISPQDLGINRQYCLNEESLNYQEEILTKKLEEVKNKEITKDNYNDINFQKKKIEIILEVVRENKTRCPRYGDREIEETTVNLNYEENSNLISNEINKKDEINFSSNFSINENFDELDVKNMSLLPRHELNDNDNIVNNSNLDDDYEEQDEIVTNENGLYAPNKTMIIRTSTMPTERMIKMPKLEKVFNRISYTRIKNIEFLSYPYETAIQLLKQVEKFHTPFEKMMIFASISSEITECINDFWKDLNGYIDNDLLNLEMDQLMAIFIYIIIQSQINNINVHCKIIKSFTTCLTKASMIGYYYSTVEAGVQYISSKDNIQELFKKKNTK